MPLNVDPRSALGSVAEGDGAAGMEGDGVAGADDGVAGGRAAADIDVPAVTVLLMIVPPEKLKVVAFTAGAKKRLPPLRLKVTAFTASPNDAPLIVPPD